MVEEVLKPAPVTVAETGKSQSLRLKPHSVTENSHVCFQTYVRGLLRTAELMVRLRKKVRERDESKSNANKSSSSCASPLMSEVPSLDHAITALLDSAHGRIDTELKFNGSVLRQYQLLAQVETAKMEAEVVERRKKGKNTTNDNHKTSGTSSRKRRRGPERRETGKDDDQLQEVNTVSRRSTVQGSQRSSRLIASHHIGSLEPEGDTDHSLLDESEAEISEGEL